MTRHTVEIDRSIEDVFDVLTDVTKTGRWYPARVEEWWVTPPPKRMMEAGGLNPTPPAGEGGTA